MSVETEDCDWRAEQGVHPRSLPRELQDLGTGLTSGRKLVELFGGNEDFGAAGYRVLTLKNVRAHLSGHDRRRPLSPFMRPPISESQAKVIARRYPFFIKKVRVGRFTLYGSTLGLLHELRGKLDADTAEQRSESARSRPRAASGKWAST